MNKIVQVAKEDVIFDPDSIGKMLTSVMRRKKTFSLAGCCEVENILIISFEPACEAPEYSIVLSPVKGEGADEVASMISARSVNGFILRGSFHIGEELWGLFEYHSPERKPL